MYKQADIIDELYDDDVVCFLAERYHATPDRVVRRFLVQDGITTEQDENSVSFLLEENEMEILRGLTRRNRS